MTMKVLFVGTPEVAVTTLRQLHTLGVNIVGVLTRQDAPQGRKRQLTPSPVAQFAQELDLPILKANKWSEELAEEVRQLQADVATVVAYGALLPASALELLPYGWINLHFSSLPAWRGAAPVQRALMAGERVIFSNTFRIEVGLDTGPVFRQESTQVGPLDTAGDILQRLASSGGELLAQTLEDLHNGAQGTPQEGTPGHAAKLTLEDGRIDWNQPSAEILARYRGVTPEPGAWCQFKDARFKIGALGLSEAPAEGSPGLVRIEGKKPVVTVADGTLELVQVQPAGKKMMNAADWARGLGADMAEKKVVLK